MRLKLSVEKIVTDYSFLFWCRLAARAWGGEISMSNFHLLLLTRALNSMACIKVAFYRSLREV